MSVSLTFATLNDVASHLLRRNISVTEQINELGEKRAKFVQLRQEKQLELDVINSDISSIEAQIANILMIKRSRKK